MSLKSEASAAWALTILTLVLAIGGGLIGWGSTNTTLKEHEVRITAIEAREARVDEAIAGMRTDLAVIREILVEASKDYSPPHPQSVAK